MGSRTTTERELVWQYRRGARLFVDLEATRRLDLPFWFQKGAFRDCVFLRCFFPGLIAQACDLVGCSFLDCNLSSADFRGANLARTRWSATLPGACFQGANLAGATLVCAGAAIDFKDAYLVHARVEVPGAVNMFSAQTLLRSTPC